MKANTIGREAVGVTTTYYYTQCDRYQEDPDIEPKIVFDFSKYVCSKGKMTKQIKKLNVHSGEKERVAKLI